MIRLAFVTGVSKFCHVSLFSDLNNLTDITMDAKYATMLGYTQQDTTSERLVSPSFSMSANTAILLQRS